MSEEEHLTEAQKQILRLEELRSRKEQDSKAFVEKAFFPPKTQAEMTTQKLQNMRDAAQNPSKKSRLDGKFKKVKLSSLQTRVLEKLKAQDKRLNGAVVTRIALNRFLDIENSLKENEIEGRILDVLRQFNDKT